MTHESELLLQKHLQKSFRLLEACVGQWETTLTECAVVVTSMANLCDQYVNCKQVDVQSLPMARTFPDVQDRLLCKITSEIDSKVKTLQEKLYLLKETQGQFAKNEEQCMKVYLKHSIELDVYKMTDCKTTWPSLSEMLEMLSNASSLLFELYHFKIHWIEQLSSESERNCEDLPRTWSTHDKEILQTIKGMS